MTPLDATRCGVYAFFIFYFFHILFVSGSQRGAIATRMRAEDYADARTMLLETLQANPRLKGAIEMFCVLEVLCATGKALLGGEHEFDWYRVLQVLPGDDADRVESRFRNIVAQVDSMEITNHGSYITR